MLPQSITQFLSFHNVYYTYRCAFLIRTQRIYFYWNRVKTDKDIPQILYALGKFCIYRAGPGPDPVRPCRSGPAQPGPGPRTYRAGPGRPQGHGPPALPVDSLAIRGYVTSKREYHQ